MQTNSFHAKLCIDAIVMLNGFDADSNIEGELGDDHHFARFDIIKRKSFNSFDKL